MRIAMIASECEPYAKTGGLADVVDALSRALGQLGHEVDVYLPRYRDVDPPHGAEVSELPVPMSDELIAPVRLWSARARGYRLRLVEHPPSYDRPDYYVANGADYADNGFRFMLLARAALEQMRVERRPVDVLHAHDWEGAPAILVLEHHFRASAGWPAMATMLTCHNLAYHGWVRRGVVSEQLGLPASVGEADGVDLLREGIGAASIVNTVSPTFARESLGADFGAGLDDVLRDLGDRYLGIINGIDTDLWNPATDTDIAARYSAADLAGKLVCRAALCDELGLDGDGPLLAMVSRLDPQKGFDLLARAAPDLIAAGARICVLGTGDGRLIGELKELGAANRSSVAFIDRFDRGLARRMYAGADAFLMPSRFEPCGQGQMIAMRYGTLPIVRRTGGLADTVVDVDAHPETGTGFVFGAADAGAFADACRRAMSAIADRERRTEIQQRAMAGDFSWSGPARYYVAAYRRAVGIARHSATISAPDVEPRGSS